MYLLSILKHQTITQLQLKLVLFHVVNQGLSTPALTHAVLHLTRLQVRDQP